MGIILKNQAQILEFEPKIDRFIRNQAKFKPKGLKLAQKLWKFMMHGRQEFQEI